VATALWYWPPKKLSPTAAAVIFVIIGLNREDVEWAKYRSNSACDCVGRCGSGAAPYCRLAVYLGLSDDRP